MLLTEDIKIELVDEIKNTYSEMLSYDDYINRIKFLCVCTLDEKNYFIVPDWKHIINETNLSPFNCIEDITYEDIYNILELEKERLNTISSDTTKIKNFIMSIFENISQEEALKILSEEAIKSIDKTKN